MERRYREKVLPGRKTPRQELESLLPTGSFWWFLESAPDGIVIVNGEGGIVLVNARAEDLFGYSEDELIGKPIEMLVPEHLKAIHMAHRSNYYSRPRTRPMGVGLELSGLRRDGVTFPVEISLSPVHTEHGLLVMAIIRDVTEYKRERFISETLQHAMLSCVPDVVDGIDVASAYRSAYEGAQVGGDFFDVFAVNPGLVALVIGDVSGKGVEASVHTALAKYSLRAYAYHDPTPSFVMEKLNSTVHQQAEPEDFVTAFYGLLNTSNNTLAFANAGHMSPLYVPHAGGDVSEILAHGPPLGVLPQAHYEQHVMPFNQGDRFLFYSDGVTEARRGDEFFGPERLMEFLHGRRAEHSDDLISHLVEALEEWSDDQLRDDIALLLISVR